jgi:hypothetical protein
MGDKSEGVTNTLPAKKIYKNKSTQVSMNLLGQNIGLATCHVSLKLKPLKKPNSCTVYMASI